MLCAYRLIYCLALKLTDYYNFIVGGYNVVFFLECIGLGVNSLL